MRVLVADSLEQSGLDGLAATGCEVVYRPQLTEDALGAALRDTQADVLIVRGTPVGEAALSADSLKLVIRAGAGYNTIDVAAASQRGIYVSNCPGRNAIAVAELAFALILALDRRLADNVVALREGHWDKTGFSHARGLYGRTLGLIGAGRIAQEMIHRARAFGMPVIAWSRSLTPQRAGELGVGHCNSPLQVAAAADVVSVHLALAPDTRGTLASAFFDAMRSGALFINTARGELVQEEALLAALRSGRIRAGLDVYSGEPPTGRGEFKSAIAREPGLYGTHHIGASTDQAQEAIAAETVRIVRAFHQTGRVLNVVNIAKWTPAKWLLVVRHRDRPGVLAQVLDAISAARINVQEMDKAPRRPLPAFISKIRLRTKSWNACVRRTPTSLKSASSSFPSGSLAAWRKCRHARGLVP